MLDQSCALVNIDIHLVYALVWHIIMKGREKIQSGPFTSNILTCPLPTNITERFIEKPFLAIFIILLIMFQICLYPPNTGTLSFVRAFAFCSCFFTFCIWYLPLTYWLAPSGNITEKKHLFVSLTLFPLSLPVSPGLLYIGIFTDDVMSTMRKGGPWHILRMHSGNKLAKQDRCESLWWNHFFATEFLPKIWRKKTILQWGFDLGCISEQTFWFLLEKSRKRNQFLKQMESRQSWGFHTTWQTSGSSGGKVEILIQILIQRLIQILVNTETNTDKY